MPIDADDLKQLCHGKWTGIYEYFNVDVGFKKNKPCPACGGTDRFWYDDREGQGLYFCRNCGAGDGFSLLMKVFNWDFPECLEQIAKVVCMIEKTEKKENTVDAATSLRALYSTSKHFESGDPVSKYLRARGLVLTPKDIMYCPQCYESDTKKRYQAMLGLIKNKAGENMSILRTYLSGNQKADIPSPKKIMPAKGPLQGCAIRLFDPADQMFDNPGKLAVAEGIETSMSVAQMFNVATWSCLSTTILEMFEPPDGIREIEIYADCDTSYAGERSAYILANKLYLKDYLVSVIVPPERGKDWNDILMQSQPQP